MSKEVEVQSPLIFYAKILINDGWKVFDVSPSSSLGNHSDEIFAFC